MKIRRNLSELFQFADVLGWGKGLAAFTKIKIRSNSPLRLNGIRYPVSLRTGSSDVIAFRQVFILREYNFKTTFDPKFIIDGGSNIGMAAVYFANKYPNAAIVSVEPETSNYNLLVENTKRYPQIRPLKSGIWGHSSILRVKDLGYGNWGFIVEELQEETPDSFKATSISDIMKLTGQKEIDILKLDVEGAEKEIFSENYREWLSATKVLVVELHDRMKEGCSKAFFKAMLEYDFEIEIMGENLVCTRKDLIQH